LTRPKTPNRYLNAQPSETSLGFTCNRVVSYLEIGSVRHSQKLFQHEKLDRTPDFNVWRNRVATTNSSNSTGYAPAQRTTRKQRLFADYYSVDHFSNSELNAEPTEPCFYGRRDPLKLRKKP